MEDGLFVLSGTDACRLGLFDSVAASGYDGMALKNITSIQDRKGSVCLHLDWTGSTHAQM